jgi:hypothetical protein
MCPTPRFAVYDPGTPADEADDLVLDKEPGLIWTRDADFGDETHWQGAINTCRTDGPGYRMGWRLPSVEELSSLLDPSRRYPSLPKDHPFINVVEISFYWSSTTYESNSGLAWIVRFIDNRVTTGNKNVDSYCVWPVRGGNGYATGNW